MKRISRGGGFSLAEVMVAVGVLGIVGLGTLAVVNNSFLVQRDISQNEDFDSISIQIQQTLSNQDACKIAFQGISYDPTKSQIVNPNMKISGVSTPLSGMTFGNLKINTVQLTPKNPTFMPGSVGVYIYQASLDISATKISLSSNSNSYGGAQLLKSFPFEVQTTAAGASPIINCFAQGNGYTIGGAFCQSILKWNPTNPPNLSPCSPPVTSCSGPHQFIGMNTAGSIVCLNLSCTQDSVNCPSPNANVFHGLDSSGNSLCTCAKPCVPATDFSGATACTTNGNAANLVACQSSGIDTCGHACTRTLATDVTGAIACTTNGNPVNLVSCGAGGMDSCGNACTRSSTPVLANGVPICTSNGNPAYQVACGAGGVDSCGTACARRCGAPAGTSIGGLGCPHNGSCFGCGTGSVNTDNGDCVTPYGPGACSACESGISHWQGQRGSSCSAGNNDTVGSVVCN
jgi:type II secretory pathway pseudopilin PulG